MDNPLTDFGNAVYQPNQPINLTYDAFGIPAAFVRGLFEYLYQAGGLTLVPHIPTTVTELEQLDPIRFGDKKLYLSTIGVGAIRQVWINGKTWTRFDAHTVFLPYEQTPRLARITLALGKPAAPLRGETARPHDVPLQDDGTDVVRRAVRVQQFLRALATSDMAFDSGYEEAHARLAIDAVRALVERKRLLASGEIVPLPKASEEAAGRFYVDTATRLLDGLDAVVNGYRGSRDRRRARVYRLYSQALAEGPELAVIRCGTRRTTRRRDSLGFSRRRL